MKRLRSLQQRDGLGIGSLLALTGVLYTAGGHVTAAFGLAAAGAWLLGPPVFAFVLGQTGLVVVLTPASPALLAVGEVALLGLLFSDVAVPAPVPAESGGPLGRGRGRRSRVGVADFDPTGCDSYSDRYRGSLIFSSSIRVGDRDWENGSTRMSSPDSDEADRNSAERTEKQVGSFEFESQPEAPESPDQGSMGRGVSQCGATTGAAGVR